jgi:hypothetical protein
MFSPDRPVYIVGGGPSLTGYNLERLRGEQVIAINRVMLELPWAKVGFFLDHRLWRWIGPEINKTFRGHVIWGRSDSRLQIHEERLSIWEANNNTVFETQFPNTISHGKSSGYAAINLAYLLGARNIILMGYDYAKKDGRGHWHKEHPTWTPPSAYLAMLAGFPALAQKLRTLGVNVWNASPGSALTEFPFADLGKLPAVALPPPLAAVVPRPVGVHVLVRQTPPWPGAALAAALPGAVAMPPAALGALTRQGRLKNSDWPILTWTVRGEQAAAAASYPGPWIVAENGAFVHWRPGDVSLGFGGYNDLRRIPPSSTPRWMPPHWPDLKVPAKKPSAPILVIGQMGAEDDPEFTHPVRWPVDVVRRIKSLTGRPVWFRPKPGYSAAVLPPADKILDPADRVEDHVDEAYAVVVWTSSVATLALSRGTPVIYEGPSIWAAEATAGKNLAALGRLSRPDPRAVRYVMQRLSWASWRRDELREAWDWLWGHASPELLSHSLAPRRGRRLWDASPSQVPDIVALRHLSSGPVTLPLPREH